MLLFGHLGITLTATQAFEKVVFFQGKKRFSNLIDYRLVLLGSMLPDIIDKPLGGLAFKETLGNGRIYVHTLIKTEKIVKTTRLNRCKHSKDIFDPEKTFRAFLFLKPKRRSNKK